MTETTAAAAARAASDAGSLQAEARETYRQSVAAEMPLSGKALGEMFGRGDRWGRARIAECRAAETARQDRQGGIPLARKRHDGTPERHDEATGLSLSEGPQGAAASMPETGIASGNGQVTEAVSAGTTRAAEAGMPERHERNSAAVHGRRSGKAYALVALLTGIGVSIAGNVMSAQKSTDVRAAWVVAAFWPVAVYLAIEVITRVEWPDRDRREWWQTLVRFAGAGAVGLVAAVVSYRHMAHLLASWGEDGISVTIGPLAIDGLVAVAATALYVIKHDKEGQSK